MDNNSSSKDKLLSAWKRIGKKPDARELFDEAGYDPDDIIKFYEDLCSVPEIKQAFQNVVEKVPFEKIAKSIKKDITEEKSNFKLIELWLENFKNLTNYTASFNSKDGFDVIIGWNGTGKSNFFEALIIIFRDLSEWFEKNNWPKEPMCGYKIKYKIDDKLIEIKWQPKKMSRPEIKMGKLNLNDKPIMKTIKREQLLLPRFIFGYYSGPTNRMAELFLPMKQAHYKRLVRTREDDAISLSSLLEKRKFFCAETHHAKYVLLAFSYKNDPQIDQFLKEKLRIQGVESALFILHKPSWARSNDATEFWGAKGVMRRVLLKLQHYAIAPIIMKKKVSMGNTLQQEEQYFLFIPNIQSLQELAGEYENARTFFIALESIDFSDLIKDVNIRVRIDANNKKNAITFREFSEGEQQLLMVLGLIRFTKSHQSIILLDEPDTHLNPHWGVEYIKDLTKVMSDTSSFSPEQQNSHIIMATHDPLVIASLLKEQVHILKRDQKTGVCFWEQPSVNPRGLGYTGILTSEMFGFRSDLDPETLDVLDNRVRIMAKKTISSEDEVKIKELDEKLADTGFTKAISDPYYAAFLRAWGRNHSKVMADQLVLSDKKRKEIEKVADQLLKEAISEVEKEEGN